MKRTYLHRYRLLSGPHAGKVFEGEQIGYQDFPGQFDQEKIKGHDLWTALVNDKAKSNTEGVFLYGINQVVRRTSVREDYKMEVGETVVYDEIYEDLVAPFDRYNDEIKVGDVVYVAVKNEVRTGEVVKIAPKVYMASYGVMQRKITVRDHTEQRTLVINDSRAAIKAPVGAKTQSKI
jgi:hypothetical protein